MEGINIAGAKEVYNGVFQSLDMGRLGHVFSCIEKPWKDSFK